MAAGLAHELNNPAAAVRRAAAQLGEAMAGAQTAADCLHATPVGDAERAFLERLRADVFAAPPALSPLERSEREEAVGAWLESRGLDDAWELAPALAAGGVTPERLDQAAAALGAERLGDVVRWLASSQSAAALLREVAHGADRIFVLVQSMKQYSNMDQGPEPEAVDLHLGLESTLALLESRLSPGITTEREYDTRLPPVCVYAGELNQVWTQLIENAVHAMEGRGRLRIRTWRNGDYAQVAITNDGPGIAPGLQERIWEPFFTTRAVGEGVGLGLEIVRYVVQRRHGGTVRLESRPGETTFEIALPLAGPPWEAQRG
jgi:signal transduction histidine kinase